MQIIRFIWIPGLIVLVAAQVLGIGSELPILAGSANSAPPPAANDQQPLPSQPAEAQKKIADPSPVQSAVQLREELAKEKTLGTELQAQVGRLAEARRAVAREISALTAKLNEIRKRSAPGAASEPSLAKLQADLENERQARAAAEDSIERGKQALAVAEQTLAKLPGACEEAEKIAAKVKAKNDEAANRIQAGLDKEKKLRFEAEAEVVRRALQRASAEKEIAEFNTRLDEAKQQAGATQQLAQVLSQAQAALDREAKLKVAVQANAEREDSALKAADKKLRKLREQLAEKQKQSVEIGQQSERIEQLKTELDQAKPARLEAEDRAKAAVAARAAVDQEVGQLESQLALLEKQPVASEQQAKAMAALQANLEKAGQQTREALAAADIQLEPLQKKSQDLQFRLKEAEKLQAEQADRARAAEALRSQLADEKRKKEEADKRAGALQDERRRLEDQAKELQAALRKMEGRIADMERRLAPDAVMQVELEKARQAHLQVAAAIQSETNAQAVLEGQLTFLAGKMASFAKLMDSMNQQVEIAGRARSELDRERKQREAAEAMLKADAAARRELEEQIVLLQSKAEKQAATKVVPPPAVERTTGGAEPEAPAATEGENVLAAEQRILAEARSGGVKAGDLKTEAATGSPGASRSKELSEADRHYQAGIQKWDQGDTDGAIVEFKKTMALNPSAAGAYYNLALAYFNKGDKSAACDNAYRAGQIYLKNKNSQQALRMVVLLKNMDPQSRLIEKLRKEIAQPAK